MRSNGSSVLLNGAVRSNQVIMNKNMSGTSNTNNIKLHVYNSLTRKKEPFIPKDQNLVKWYTCGPTVYDSAHMGHARTYISFDIIRRIMEDYFGYNIWYCMNITDIDDKIIKRAREHYLFDQYIKSSYPANRVDKDILSALKYLERSISTEDDIDKKSAKEKIFMKAKESYRNRLLNAKQDVNISNVTIVDNDFSNILPEWLDHTQGRQVQDTSIFMSLPRQFETEFHMDMASLNIKPATVITRVSEYVDEIVNFIKLIVKNGFAYVFNSSVYFDTEAFKKSSNHRYGKLLPEAVGDLRCLAEGEGALSSLSKSNSDKKNKNDFALWKTSKLGEPSWQSPWGKGRPGWHIECSAMASSILGKEMDIHSGGVDLKFPHHDNEIAQSEAAFNSDHWIKYFLHSGHLTIQGCKMSKSLKNFITIRKSLEMYTFRQIRLLFLLHSWNDTLDFSDNAMNHTIQFEKMSHEFFLLVKDWIRNSDPTQASFQKKWTNREMDLNIRFNDCRRKVYSSLCDSFDTPTAMDAIRSMISLTNAYLDDKTNQSVNVPLAQSIALYIDNMFKTFGLYKDNDDFGFTCLTDASSANIENAVLPFVNVLKDFRDTVRNLAREHKVPALLQECDTVRDVQLIELGVKLEDRDGRTVVKMYDPQVLKAERLQLEKELSVQSKESNAKNAKNAEMATLKEEKEAQKKIPPEELFTKETDKYSNFDSKGFPTADNEGNLLTKSAIKKLSKIYQLQEKRYKDWINSQKVN